MLAGARCSGSRAAPLPNTHLRAGLGRERQAALLAAVGNDVRNVRVKAVHTLQWGGKS